MCVRVTLNIIIAGSQHIKRVAFLPIFPEIADLYGHGHPQGWTFTIPGFTS